MSQPSSGADDWEALRASVIGFGEQSTQKSYYPELQLRIAELERSVHDIADSMEALKDRERWLTESQRVARLGHYVYNIAADRWDGSAMLYEVLGVDENHVRDLEGWLDMVHPDDRERLRHYFTDDVLGKREPFDIEYRVVRPRDGVERWVHGLGTVEFREDDTPFAMFGIIQDITERKLGEARLQELLDERTRHLNQLNTSLTSLVQVVGQVVESRDPYTAGHQRRVTELAVAISEDMGHTAEQTEEIRVAALLHDIGKMSVPAELLSKPGRLTAVEFELIKGHAEAGYGIISAADMEGLTAQIVYQHHERCDGSGYPRGLTGKEICQSAKVLAVADVVEAMVSHRPYRPGFGIDVALAEIEQGSGKTYDDGVCASCIRVFREKGFSFSEQ